MAITTATRTKKPADAKDIEMQISQLTDDLAALTKIVSSYGDGKAAELKGKANQKGNEIVASTQEIVDTAKEEMSELEKNVKAHVRSQPLRSVGIAAAVGFVLALIIKN